MSGAGHHLLSASHYAEHAKQYPVGVTENKRLAHGTYRLRIECPELAQQIVPGQFLMVRIAGCEDPLLGRPFALYDTVLDHTDTPWGLDIVYLVVGKMTGLLEQSKPGDRLEVWGPLGNGFSTEPIEHLILVAGGIGQTPFLALGREFLGARRYGQPARQVEPARRVTLCYGVRSKDLLAGADDFRKCGIDLRISSDDGSVGHHGLVTDLLNEALSESARANCRVACCGPEPMMKAIAAIAQKHSVPCEVSLETPMACGIGICFSCVVKTEQPEGGWDYKRTCVEGPVFEAEKILW